MAHDTGTLEALKGIAVNEGSHLGEIVGGFGLKK